MIRCASHDLIPFFDILRLVLAEIIKPDLEKIMKERHPERSEGTYN